MVECGIYAIISPSGKAYIGSSVRVPKRKTRHFYDLRSNIHHCAGLQAAWNRYNGQGFKFVVLESCSREILIEREQWWLDNSIFKGGYNSSRIAGNVLEVDPVTRGRISKTTLGKPKSEETKQKMRKPKSLAHAAAISAGKKGKPYTYNPEYLEKKQAAMKVALEAMRLKRERAKGGMR